MKKHAIRQQFLTLRSTLDGRERLRLDDLLLLQFQQFNYADVATVMSYWPLSQQRNRILIFLPAIYGI